MAYRRSIAARVNLFYQHERQQRISPSISNIHRRDNDSEEFQTKSISRYPEFQNYIQHRFSVTGNNYSNYHDRRFAFPAGYGMAYSRNYSSSRAVEAASVVNEVAVAAANSSFPVAALQFMTDYVHCFTGLDWWASIVVTTLILRFLELPFTIKMLKSNARFALWKPHWEAVKQESVNKRLSSGERLTKMRAAKKEYNVSLFTPLMGPLITTLALCFYSIAINNMAAKVPSFKDGGVLWFTDLSTPDSLYIFPVLTALAVWAVMERGLRKDMEGSPYYGMVINVTRGYVALIVPITASFPKALYCYWLTCIMFSVVLRLVIEKPEVKNYLGIPIVPVTPPSPNQKPFVSFVKTVLQSQKSAGALLKPMNDSPPPNLRFRSLEKKVKNLRSKKLEEKVKRRKNGKKM